MVVSPMLRGMLGLSTDAKTGTVTFSPHVPADWHSFCVRNVRSGNSRLNLTYTAKPDSIVLDAECVGSTPCKLAFKPAISLRAHVAGVTSGRRAIPFHVTPNDQDQHVEVVSSGSGKFALTIQVKDNFGFVYNSKLPALGNRQRRFACAVANLECFARYADSRGGRKARSLLRARSGEFHAECVGEPSERCFRGRRRSFHRRWSGHN